MKIPSPLAQCQYPKLVRDKMPEIIRREGYIPIYRKLDGSERRDALVLKLKEECSELIYAIDTNDRVSIAGEIGDLFDVLTALSYAYSVYISEVEIMREQKSKAKGGFNEGIWMEAVKINV